MDKKRVLLFLVFFNLKPFAQGIPDSWIGIDCGANRSTPTNGILWQTDESFIQTGTNHPIPDNNLTQLPILNTLRLFQQQNKNCYTLPASTMTRFFIRAVFFYANYDGLSTPPTFDLQIDGNKWATVVTSSTEAQYFEILYWCLRPNISVCLARTQNDQFSFISSLEAWSVPDSMYTGMSQDLAWLNNYRYNYGPSAVNTTADPGDIYDRSDEYLPDSIITNVIECAQNGTSLYLTFEPVKAVTPIVIEAYFTEPLRAPPSTRSFDIYINGKSLATVAPDHDKCTAVPVLVQSLTSTLTVELRPTGTSSLPPTISAVEIYTASDPLVTNGTYQDDLDGLEEFTSTFHQLKGWSGEPCLPEDTVWQWLGCTGTDPPRVTSLNLSGYGLNGVLPDFSQMQALEDIDLSKNRLSGQVPGFLGQLPNLKKLNLSYNNFSGTLPSTIHDNTRLTYDIAGNPNMLNTPPTPNPSGKGKHSKALKIGLSVGIPLGFIVLVCVLCCRNDEDDHDGHHHRPPLAPPGIGNGTVNGSFTTSASTEQLIRPQPPPPRPIPTMGPVVEEDNDYDDGDPVSEFDTSSMRPMAEEEDNVYVDFAQSAIHGPFT